MVVLRGMMTLIWPPLALMPRDSGVTSSSSTPFTSPASTPPCTAAPTATTSSGFTLLLGSRPKMDLTSSWTLGVRVEPPTRTTSSISWWLSLASLTAFSQGIRSFWRMGSSIASNRLRVRVWLMCLGPLASAVM